jgi:hypothetical protein
MAAKFSPPISMDLEHDRRYPPENAVIQQLAKILNLSPDVLYFYAKRIRRISGATPMIARLMPLIAPFDG